MENENYDVVILGAGLAGLTLARQILMDDPNRRILQLEKREIVPCRRQKVGESSVQVGGYYLGKTLDLEEYLFHEHLMKYNLRFLWPTAGRENGDIEDYGQGFIRNFSNIACYQLDRNKLEKDLILLNGRFPNYRLLTGVSLLEVDLGQEGAAHRCRFTQAQQRVEVTAGWVVDTTGRKRLLASKMGLKRSCEEITHGASWFWVDGTLNLEKLTRTPHKQQLLRPSRRIGGHLPYWLSTSHFMGEGFWLWVIPLQGRTSIGVVYDQQSISPSQLSSQSRAMEWLFKTFPLFKPALENQTIIDFTTLRQYSHDCAQTINRDRWAISGEAGRFTDPLYSPGSDMIAIHNSLIVEAMKIQDPEELKTRVSMYENMLKILFRSFIPTFSLSYKALGSHETFFMKYSWELSVYFVFYAFPFMNQLLTNKHFLIPYFRRFSLLGPVNRNLLTYISDYYCWRKQHLPPDSGPAFTDFSLAPALASAETTFYQVGLKPGEAIAEIEKQLLHLFEYARYLIAHMDSVVLGEPELVNNQAYVAQIDLGNRSFDPQQMEKVFSTCDRQGDVCNWSFCPKLLRNLFHGDHEMAMNKA